MPLYTHTHYFRKHLIFGIACSPAPPNKVGVICVLPLSKLLHLSEFLLNIFSRVSKI